MKKIIFIGILAISCTKTEVVPVTKIVTDTLKIVKTDTLKVPTSLSNLTGTWQLVTNNGIDATFDIIHDPNGSDTLYTTNARITYKGVTSNPVTFFSGNHLNYGTQINNYQYNGAYTAGIYYMTLTSSVGSGASIGYNRCYFANLKANSSNTQITFDSGWVSVVGYTSPADVVINLIPPIVMIRK